MVRIISKNVGHYYLINVNGHPAVGHLVYKRKLRGEEVGGFYDKDKRLYIKPIKDAALHRVLCGNNVYDEMLNPLQTDDLFKL